MRLENQFNFADNFVILSRVAHSVSTEAGAADTIVSVFKEKNFT